MPGKLSKLRNVVALDLGTTKFCLATLRPKPGDQGLMADTVSIPAEGMRRGMLADLAQVKVALSRLVETAEKQFEQDIGEVVVGVAGSHLRSRIVTGAIAVESGLVGPKDLEKLVERVEAEHQSETRELLHVVPIGYRVDQRDSVDQPIGFNGKVLAGDFFLIDADKLYLKDVVDVCNASGLQVARLYSEPFASAAVTIPDRFKELGVALCDIGGGTTDGIVFRRGRPTYAFTVNVAGKLMTSDLSIGLNITPDDAETLKLRYGLRPREGDLCELTDVRGVLRPVRPEDAVPILGARVHELCHLVAKELVPFRGSLGAGLLLTGGAAGVKGLPEFFQQKMGIPVTRARPVLPAEMRHVQVDPVQALAESPHPTKHATVLGLLNLELHRLEETTKQRRNTWTNRYLGPILNWFKELS